MTVAQARCLSEGMLLRVVGMEDVDSDAYDPDVWRHVGVGSVVTFVELGKSESGAVFCDCKGTVCRECGYTPPWMLFIKPKFLEVVACDS